MNFYLRLIGRQKDPAVYVSVGLIYQNTEMHFKNKKERDLVPLFLGFMVVF